MIGRKAAPYMKTSGKCAVLLVQFSSGGRHALTTVRPAMLLDGAEGY